jgi:DNA-binding NarL/FixJ family response regulator
VRSPSQLRILIADDHDVIRRGLRCVLSSQPGWLVCAEAATGLEAVAKAEQHRPDIVVMDIVMPELNGLEAARRIRNMLPETEILVLSLHYTDQLVREVIDAGAHAYVLKSDADRDLIVAVEALANRRSFFTAAAAQLIATEGFKGDSAPGAVVVKHSRITSREREVVRLVAEGKSCKELAKTLGISVKTAETHKANIMRKLEFHSITELVRYAIRNRFIEP